MGTHFRIQLVAAHGLTVATLCLGHTLGMHRLLIHRSYECPRWLEHAFVYLGVLVGIAGPFRIVYLHDIRDWSQRYCDIARAHPPRSERVALPDPTP